MATDDRVRARQFDALFRDPHTYTWVLDAGGRLARANESASELVATAPEELSERPFWSVPLWADESAEHTVQDAVEAALDGRFETVDVAASAASGERRLELNFRPVEADEGVASVVVDGRDITARGQLERELRESEELHRVTLNNMTDTVLITDDEGAFTYVCPNVHFIFGYSAEEIYEMGTIDELLGDGVPDREELGRAGVLTNVECAAEDKAGREHVLLVNAREVSIQGGTVLYSCRDVTKRKRREEALTALHRTTQELQYAETASEIGRIAVEDADDVLDLRTSAVFLFDEDASVLEPVAHSPQLPELHGPLPTHDADANSIPGRAFVKGEPRFFDDVHDAEELSNPATDVRGCAVVPLGDHGVFLAGSADVGVFDDVTRELTELLAATVQAALDRVERESRLRRQERALQRQNRKLSTLNRINEFIREIDQALVSAETREEVERAVCERLTANDRFAFAWIGEPDGEGRLEPRVWEGTEDGYLDEVTLDREASAEPATRTARTGEVTAVASVTDELRAEAWRSAALTRGFQSVLGVPLSYDEVLYGVLTVYAGTPEAFDEPAKSVLAELGETVASAISGVERKSALLVTARTRLAFDVRDESFLLSRLARAADCTVIFEGGVRQVGDAVRLFVSVEDGDVGAAADVAADFVSVTDVQPITDAGDGGVLRLELADSFVAATLADHGAVLQRVRASPTAVRLVVDVPDVVDPRSITELVSGRFDEAELVSKQSLEDANTADLYAAVRDRLTDRQLEVIQAAYYGGYFESPRESTGEDVADALDISPPAFYDHARTVQRKLFSLLFESAGSASDRQ